MLDPTWEDDEEATATERQQIRKEDRDPEKAKQKTLSEILKTKPSETSDLATKSFDQPEPQAESGSGQLRLHAAGAAPQIAVGNFQFTHHFWRPIGLGGKSEAVVDFLRGANQALVGGQIRLQLGRYLSLFGDVGGGLGSISQWVGFRGELGVFLPSLVADKQDSRVSLKLSSQAGTLGSLNSSVPDFAYSELIFGVRGEQELPASWVIRFDFDIGIPSTLSGRPFRAQADEFDRREDTIHLVHAALSRSVSGVEGALLSSRWMAGVGFQPGRDLRVLIDGGQMGSSLFNNNEAKWWVFSPKVEAQISSHAHLLIEGVFAPVLAQATASSALPGSFYLGRLGLRVQWW